MNLLSLIESRYSCRDYQNLPVEQEKIDYILECVRMAPSAVNFQPWRFYVITSEEDKRKIQACYKRDWFLTAPMYIMATLRHDEEWVRKDGKRHGDIDVAIAVEHLCLAATEQGLATCWVCNFHEEIAREQFNLPEDEEAIVLIPIGYANPATPVPDKTRKPLSDIVIK